MTRAEELIESLKADNEELLDFIARYERVESAYKAILNAITPPAPKAKTVTELSSNIVITSTHALSDLTITVSKKEGYIEKTGS